MLEGIHEARTDEFRRVLRACALALAKGRQAVVLSVPGDEDPRGFLRAFSRHVVRKGGRPVRLIESFSAPAAIAEVAAALGGPRSVPVPASGALMDALDARERCFERWRAALERGYATEDEAGAPGLLVVDADLALEPDLRAFLVHLSPRETLWRALGIPRGGRAVVVGVVSAEQEEQAGVSDLEVVRVRPIEARDLRAASEAALELWWSRMNGSGEPGFLASSDPRGSEQVSASDLVAVGAYEAALVRGLQDARTRLWCLVAVGRADEALEVAQTFAADPKARDLVIEMAQVALTWGRIGDAEALASCASVTGRATTDCAALRAEVALARAGLEEAARWAEEAVRLAEGPAERARAWNVAGKVAFRAGRHEEATQAFEQVVRQVPPEDGEAVRATHNLALVALRLGEHARAAALLQEAAVRADEAGLVFGAAVARHNLAVALEYLGRYGAAWQFAAEAADRFARTGRRANLAGALHTLADLLATFGEWDRAAALLEQAEETARGAGSVAVGDLCERTRAEMALARGAAAQAAEGLRAVVTRLEARGLADDADFCRARLAEALFEAGRVAEARIEAERVIGRGRGPRDEATGRAWLVVARAVRAERGPGQALSALARAREVLAASGQREPLAMATMALANTLGDLGDEEAARDLQDETRALLDEVADQVPPEYRRSFDKRVVTLLAPGACESRGPRESADGGSTGVAQSADEACRVPSRPVRARLRHLVPHIVGESEALERVLATIERVRNVAVPVLLVGESGTGKELFAEALHRLSSRSSGPFVRVNAAAFTDTLLLSELFGHEKGAFTDAHARRVGRFEAAHGGTLFLDEIGDVSERLQNALLRVLEDQSFQRVGGVETIHVDVRLVFATNKDLHALMKAGRFREDLYHRISGVVVRVPPLRERVEDIPALVGTFVREAAREAGRSISVGPDALALLKTYPWPGNIRELRNVVRRTCLLVEGTVLTREILVREAPDIARRAGFVVTGGPDAFDAVFGRGRTMDEALREVEAALVREALARTRGNIAAAARILGVKRPRLSQMVKEHDLKAVGAKGEP